MQENLDIYKSSFNNNENENISLAEQRNDENSF